MPIPLEGTDRKDQAKKVRYSHDAMIDAIIADPNLTQRQLATMFGYSETLISRLFCSDVFLKRLADRKGELVDPAIVAGIEDRLKGLAMMASDVVAEKLAASRNPDLAVKVLEMSTKALGYGARQNNVNIQQNFVAVVPEKAKSAIDWAARHSPVQMVEEAKEVGPVAVPASGMSDLARLAAAVQP